MKVEITDVLTCENKRVEKEVHIDFDSFQSKLGEFPIAKCTPFNLTLENEDNKKLTIQGKADFTLKIPCGRCLEDVPTTIHLEINRSVDIATRQECVEGEMDDANYMDGCNLDVDKLIYSEILVNWPMKVLCKPDCKGICKKCGTNLNLRQCDCDKTELDPRMAAIQDIFNKFKEV